MVTHFFLDSSAILKRYVMEAGNLWVQQLTDPANQNIILISEITLAEIAAVFAAKQRASSGISLSQRDAMLNLFLAHCNNEYRVIATTRYTIDRAVDLTQRHKLRGCDSIQLAAALVTNEIITKAGLAALTFVAADHDLLQATQNEGLLTHNPI